MSQTEGEGYRDRMQQWDDRHRGLHEGEWNDQAPRRDPVDGVASSLGCAAAVTLLLAPVVLLALAGLALLQTLGRFGPELETVVATLGAADAPWRGAGLVAGGALVLLLVLLVVRALLVRGWLRDPRAGRAGLVLAVVPPTLAGVLVVVVGLTLAVAVALVAAGQGPGDTPGGPVPLWAWIAAGVGVLGWTSWFSLRAMHRATARKAG